MHKTRNILMKREIYHPFSEKKSLVSSDKREICCFFFTGTVLFEISCTQDFKILFSKGHNSEKGHNSDMKKNTGQLFFHEECAYEISKP